MTHAQSDDFDIAKTIFDQLKDLPSERQQRVLRWIAEGLGVVHGVVGTVTPSQTTPLPQNLIVPPPHAASGATDIKSFIASKAPKSDVQFATAVAYFYRFEAPPAAKRDSINGEFLQEAARLAGRTRLTNPRGTLNNAKAGGYLDGAARGEFSINSVGENLVAMTLPGGGEAPKKKRPGKKASKSKAVAKKR